MQTTLELAQQLINIESITPNDNGCQDLLTKELDAMGFKIIHINSNGVSNLLAIRGNQAPLLAFSGHTDVVPPGPLDEWQSAPFQAETRDGFLYGRGAADMKGALAAMLIGCKNFLAKNPNPNGSIAFMITSDEEGDATDGTKKIIDYIKENKIKVDFCIIGEASSSHQVGDAIKIGRRGSLHGYLQVFGKQGHIAYPQFAENPIHRSFKALDQLSHTEWDQGNEHFSPTSFQIYNILADTGASNIIPGSLSARFNFRYAPSSHADELKQRVHKVFDDHQLNHKIEWDLMSEPFLSTPGKLTRAVSESIKDICRIETNPNTTGGTSDGRFIARLGCEIVELGAVNACIHQVNEHIRIDDLNTLTTLYESVLQKTVA